MPAPLKASHQGGVLGKFDIDVNQLWVEERVANGDIAIHKIGRETNIADNLTKHVERARIEWHTDRTYQAIRRIDMH